MALRRGTVFAIGCRPESCAPYPVLTTSDGGVVRSWGEHGGAFYFQAVGGGSATIWASFRNSLNCSPPPHSPQPERCPAVRVEVRATS
jgi:hypothetical protein